MIFRDDEENSLIIMENLPKSRTLLPELSHLAPRITIEDAF